MRVKEIWIQLRSSLWFVPGLVFFAATGLALGLIEFDAVFGQRLAIGRLRLLLGASPDGARSMLTAIAGSMITVAGVAFSITIVTLSLASTQYTPRILRNFMRDRANQFVLGVFVGIFSYCLIVLRSIRSPAEGGEFVPLVAVFVGLLLALLGIGCFIYFIHHVAASIQASYILNAISGETIKVIDGMFPDENGDSPENDPALTDIQGQDWQTITAERSGYLQAINQNLLINCAQNKQCYLRLELIPGDFVTEGAPLVSTDRPPDEQSAKRMHAAFVIGDFRTIDQDARFGFRQIVDIAVKALSPGVNDTSTAVSCLDYLSVLLSQLANRRLYPLFVHDKTGAGIVTKLPSFADYVAKAFDEIRLSADGNVIIYLQMLCAMQRIAAVTKNHARRLTLLDQARVILASADSTVCASYDRDRINGQLRVVRDALKIDESLLPPLSAAAPASPKTFATHN